MPIYKPDGNLVTDKKSSDLTWDTQTEWEAYQSKTDISISNGIVQLNEITTPDSGVSRWTFDDADTDGSTAADVWGDDDGTINGATTGVSGKFGEAYSFDGTDDNVYIGAIPELESATEFSISLWVNDSSFPGQFIPYFGYYPDIDNGIFIGHTPDGDALFNVETNTTRAIYDDGTPIPTGQWNHMVLVWDAPDMTAYFNNSEVATESGPSQTVSSTDFYVCERRGTGETTDAEVDDPQVYDKALSSDEVDSIFNTGTI
jgi:hypothetical protein